MTKRVDASARNVLVVGEVVRQIEPRTGRVTEMAADPVIVEKGIHSGESRPRLSAVVRRIEKGTGCPALTSAVPDIMDDGFDLSSGYISVVRKIKGRIKQARSPRQPHHDCTVDSPQSQHPQNSPAEPQRCQQDAATPRPQSMEAGHNRNLRVIHRLFQASAP